MKKSMLGFVKGNADIMRMIENYDMMKAGGIYLGQKVALAKGSCEGKVMDGYVEKGGGSFAAGTKGAWELGVGTELCDKRWFGFEIEYLLMARLFRIQYQNQYLYFLAIITDTDINTAQWVIL